MMVWVMLCVKGQVEGSWDQHSIYLSINQSINHVYNMLSNEPAVTYALSLLSIASEKVGCSSYANRWVSIYPWSSEGHFNCNVMVK